MRLFVVVNPRAHSGRAGKRYEGLARAFRDRGLAAEFHVTQGPGDAWNVVAGLAPGQCDAVVSAGGDGTLFEVVNGLMARPEGQRETLGVLPLGTGNAFARDLGLEPGDLEGALDRIASGGRQAVDVAEVVGGGERFHFINMFGVGFVVRAGRAAQALKALGRGAYTLGALAALVRLPDLPLALELDGESIAPRDTLFLQIANSRFTGTRFLMAPEARIDDGLLDVVHVRRLPRHRALRLFPTIYDGRHVMAPEVTVHRARRIRLAAPAGLACLVDGEFRGETPVDITCLAGALEILGDGPA